MNLLAKTRIYAIGHMQYADGRGWREYVEEELKHLGITVFNPYDKPFIKDIDESEEVRSQLDDLMLGGKYDEVAGRMKIIRSYDLNLVDRSDFIIAHIIPHVASWGTAEELSVACHLKRPVFVSVEGGKSKTPLWMMGMLPHKYIYDSIEDVIDMIKKIDNNEIEIDSDRWRLLRKELR